jgi:hypothetical protein
MSEYTFEGDYAESTNYLNSITPTSPSVLDENYTEQIKAALEYGKLGDLQKVLLMCAEIDNKVNNINAELSGDMSNYKETYFNAAIPEEPNNYLNNYKKSFNG